MLRLTPLLNAKADALGVDRWFASLRHYVCYDYPCFVILERSEGTNDCICRGRSCACPFLAVVFFGHPQGMPLRYLFSVISTLFSFGHPQGMPLRLYNNKRSPAGDLLLLKCNAVIR